MAKFQPADRLQQGDKVTWYNDKDGQITGIVVDVVGTNHKGVADKYRVKVGSISFDIPEPALDKIPMAQLEVQKHNSVTAHTSLESAELFSIITMATNYANERLNQIKRDGLKNFKITDPGLDNKVRLLRESYEYWNNEVEKLYKLNNDLRR